MSMIREIVTAALWQGHDPFVARVSSSPDATHPHDSVEPIGVSIDACTINGTGQLPRVVVDAGAGDGSTTVRVARLFREQRHDGVVIAVDTWLGSWEDWCARDASTRRRFGSADSTRLHEFLHRVRSEDVQGYVVPLPLDDFNAFTLLKRNRVSVDLLHLDLRVGRMSAEEQLKLWWPLLRGGGRLVARIGHRNQHALEQTRQTIEIFADGHEATVESDDTLIRVDKRKDGSLTSHRQTRTLGDLPDAPRTLDYEGEFGPELVLFWPYVTWLSRAGLLRNTRVVIHAGMRCYYDHLECGELVVKHSPRRHVVEQERLACMPVKSELLYDVAELSPFHVYPDLRRKFGQMPTVSALNDLSKPLLIVHNKFVVEWNRPPINYIGLDLLDHLFGELSREFAIVYIRHGMTPEPSSYSRDDNFSLPFDDRSVLNAHPAVMCFDDVYAGHLKDDGAQDVNTFKNVLYSRCHHFISSQGGGASHAAFFSGSLLMILHRYGREERLAYGNGFYGFVANPAPIRAICLTDDEFLRGLRLFQDSSVIDGRTMIASDSEPLMQELSPWTIEKRRDGKWSR